MHTLDLVRSRRRQYLKPTIVLHLCLFLIFSRSVGVQLSAAQVGSYRQTDLVSDVPGRAHHTDPNLINPWGIAFKPGFPFLLSDNKRGVAKAYDASGLSQRPGSFAIPTPAGDQFRATPTGAGFDFTSSFIVMRDTPAQFIFATGDGIIAGWCCIDSDFLQIALPAVDNSSQHAVYKGLAILAPDFCAPYLIVTNFNSGEVEP